MYWRRCRIFATLVLHIISCFSVPLSDFYPYGVSEGDNALPPNDDGSSEEIPISILYPYFDKNHHSLYVSRQYLFALFSMNYVISVISFISLFFKILKCLYFKTTLIVRDVSAKLCKIEIHRLKEFLLFLLHLRF